MDYRAGRMDAQTARAMQVDAERNLRMDAQRIVQSDLPAVLGEIEQKAKTGRYPCYLVPGQLYIPQLGPALTLYLMGLNAAGMRPYFVYDLTGKAGGS